jgi:hypothetical protein
MKLNEVIAKYGNQEVDESKIKEVLGVKESKVWEPSYDEYYYYYTGSDTCCAYFNADLDQEMFMIGNCFRTQEEAKFARDKQIFLTKFERYLRENEDEPVDWTNFGQNKFVIRLDHGDNSRLYFVSWCSLQQQGSIYTTNRLVLEQFIKDNESDIKKYMFGVE